MKLSVTALTIALALLEAISFLFVALMNLILRPYGGAHLAILTSLFPDTIQRPDRQAYFSA